MKRMRRKCKTLLLAVLLLITGVIIGEVNVSAAEKEITIDSISVKQDSFNGLWQLKFADANYTDAIKKISVNDTDWEAYSFTPSMGGKYRIRDGAVEFAQKSYSQTAALKNGDVISITATGYKTLAFKVAIADGKLTISQDTKPGDNMKLYVRLVGSFESALVNQKGYDAISGASTNVTQNKNSDASVEVALVNADQEPTKDDWKLLSESGITINSKQSKVNLDSSCGMVGVYSVHDGSVTLAGTPSNAGTYEISVTITDDQGRTATSNTLTFKVYTGNEYLVYTESVVDEDGEVVVYVSKIINDAELTTIEDENEWERIKKFLWMLGMDGDFSQEGDLDED